MIEYTHRVQYYETDQMGIVHHSNYIRWFEEARLYYMNKSGVHYKEMEKNGLICPVLSVHCDYNKSSYFDDDVIIQIKLTEFGNVRHKFSYIVTDSKTGEIRATGESTHCTINKEGHAISIKRKDPELFDKMSTLVEA